MRSVSPPRAVTRTTGKSDLQRSQRTRRMDMRDGPAAAIALAALPARFVGQSAGAHATHESKNAVFVQTNELTGNRVVVYDRAQDGTLALAGSYATGGLGGAALP